MKLLSTSPSISSSSTTCLDANVCTSKSTTAGCLAGILRRILCSRSLPTHPSDHITEASSIVCDKDQDLKAKEKIEATATPGIVARLMGLDSVPEIKLVSSHISPNSVARSRSMNSVDCRVDSDQMQGMHRRVKSTLSFRELPTFLELENEEFIVLSFERGSESEELRFKERKCEVGFGELKRIRGEKCRNKENKAEKVLEKKMVVVDQEPSKKALNENKCSSRRISDKPNNVKDSTDTSFPLKDSCEKPCVATEVVKRSKVINHKEVVNAASLKKKMTINRCLVKDVEPECSSEESSPVSVLDFGQFIIDPEGSTSEEAKRSAESNSRRKLSPELENCKHLSPRNDSDLVGNDQKMKTIEGKSLGSRKKECHNKNNYLDMWSDICKLTEAEIKVSNWMYKKISKVEEFEIISAGFGSQIFDQLLDELVDQLASPMQNLNL